MPGKKKKDASKRLYTPQEIMAYYQKKGKLPPGMQERIEK